MGQSTSKEHESDRTNESTPKGESLMDFFNDRCLKQLTTAELISFKNNIPEGKELNDYVEVSDISRMYYIPKDNAVMLSVFMNMFHTLANFPLLQDSYERVTFKTLLKATLLLVKERGIKYTDWKKYDDLKMLFITLSLEKNIKAEPFTDSSALSDCKDWKRVIRSYNGIDFDELKVNANNLLHFLALILALSRCCILNNCKIDNDVLAKSLEDFKHQALNIIRTMNPEIISMSECLDSSITYTEFSKTVNDVAPNLLNPLKMLVEHVLYMDRDLVDADVLQPISNPTKIVNESELSQLATFLPKEIVFSRFQKLYVGRESGFSMRSFQSKVFKWMAPTILFVEGMRIRDEDNEDGDAYAVKNPRYRNFLREYGKLKSEDQHLDTLSKKKRKLLFAVCIRDPWKVSNKDLFGDSSTKIIQLHPRQEIFDADPFKTGNVYFNTVGGGIGIGNSQPIIKANGKKYFPGNVSLTIDSSLEFGIFRHLGAGGSFKPGRLISGRGEERNSFEYRFIIQDVEVWGCGGEKELEEQVKQWQWEEAEAKRRQKINLQSMGEDRALLEMAGLVGQHQSGGSI
ncbi:Rtc5 [Kluyveromyces lactis]|nr:Rtc5 [Kluyveromyces lactis]